MSGHLDQNKLYSDAIILTWISSGLFQ